ncbi:leucyl aminopeptidase [secondary endosymbiont of Heteropsylla cubana]|uniref:Leucyl aminopeptidase n=1 Tax=secondary endosymbiont of Heteropsylla cubana TaxID=134287 RepID=J3Z5G2_9ENTR|nr:aminopeptidase PepB [secondary endosymbiont of Heteropsylla cubana]AFP85569.1 leucyl aminopeptidase [secondary endosymbiont of Heteropsylla cubana]
MTKAMQLTLSSTCASPHWGGKKALLSADNSGMTIHLTTRDPLIHIQEAGRTIDTLGIRQIALVGKEWDLTRCWTFWQGYRNPKGGQHLILPKLSEIDNKTFNAQMKIIDWVRNTINLPANELGPKELVECALSMLSGIADYAINYNIMNIDELVSNHYTGLHSVGCSSNRQPVLLTLDYNPTGNKEESIMACLVGKGITFDTGGYSLKTNHFMESMKSDMGGAATLTGALALAIQRGLKKRVRLILCCADNMVSGNALKLGDIIRFRNGKSVEVMNTDAEGRLILADGLIDASLVNSRIVIDCATLTGAAKTALGDDYHAFFSFDDNLASQLLKSAHEEGELFWRLPLAEFHRNHLQSSFADLSNVANSESNASASTAAAFLSHFIKNYRQGWIHVDCSATYRKISSSQWSVGATGLGVKTLTNLLMFLEKLS